LSGLLRYVTRVKVRVTTIPWPFWSHGRSCHYNCNYPWVDIYIKRRLRVRVMGRVNIRVRVRVRVRVN
jgi:hypothetical protein